MDLINLLKTYAEAALSEEIDLPANRKFWPEEWLESFEERSGIMEFDGGMERVEAERMAEGRLREKYKDEQLNKTSSFAVKIEVSHQLKKDFNRD